MAQPFKRILIVRTDRIGDVVLTTPIFKALREKFPDAVISVLTAKSTEILLRKNPHIDVVLVDDKKGIHRGIKGFIRLVASLKKCQFDWAINLHTKKRTNLMLFFAGIPHRLGYKNNKFGFLLNHPVVDQRHLGLKHEAQYCLDLLKEIGIDKKIIADDQLINTSEKIPDALNKFIQSGLEVENKTHVLIHPGGSDPSKCWPVKNFIELINRLSKEHPEWRFIIIGDAHVKHAANQICQKTSVKIIDLTGETSLIELVTLIKSSKLLISNDSGPVHVASACKTPVVSIFPRNCPGINPERWHPLSAQSKTVAAPQDLNASFKDGNRFNPSKLDAPSVLSVLQAVDALINVC